MEANEEMIVSDASLSRMKFNELWPMMLEGYAQQFNVILRVVGIALRGRLYARK